MEKYSEIFEKDLLNKLKQLKDWVFKPVPNDYDDDEDIVSKKTSTIPQYHITETSKMQNDILEKSEYHEKKNVIKIFVNNSNVLTSLGVWLEDNHGKYKECKISKDFIQIKIEVSKSKFELEYNLEKHELVLIRGTKRISYIGDIKDYKKLKLFYSRNVNYYRMNPYSMSSNGRRKS